VAGLENVEVREGDEAILSCTTPSNILVCLFVTPTGEIKPMTPGINYEDGRIIFHGENKEKECGIKITNVKEADNGEWKCQLTTSEGKQGQKTAVITVAKPPSDIHIEVDGAATNSIVVTPENKMRKVKCVANGGRPAATFSWTMGDESYTGPVETESTETGLAQVLTYESQPGHNGKQLTCNVAHSGFTQDQIASGANQATLSLDVQFLPVPAPEAQTFYNLKVGTEQVILMNFQAHPKPKSVSWSMYDGTEVAMGADMERYAAEEVTVGPTDGMFTARLVIKDVMAEDSGTSNELTVENDLGTTKYKFTLALGEKPPSAPAVSDTVDGTLPTQAAGSGPVIAIVIVALIIIVVIVVAVIARSQGMLCFADPPKTDDDKEKAVDKEEGSDTESAEQVDGAKEEKDAATVEEGAITNNNTKKSVSARVTSLLSAVKKSVGSKKEKYSETESEVKLQENEEKKDGEDSEEKKEDSIVYADLDKSAMTADSKPSITVENEKTEYADIKPQTKE